MTEAEKERHLEIRRRGSQYLRLGFTEAEIVDGLLPLDDQLWEEAKDLPIDPDNIIDRPLKKFE